jgi:GT2 family glycosyltransferase
VNEVLLFCRISEPSAAAAFKKRLAGFEVPLRLYLSTRRDLFESIQSELAGDLRIGDIAFRQIEHPRNAMLDLVALLRDAAPSTNDDALLLFLDSDVSHADGLGTLVNVAQLHDDLCGSSGVVRSVLGQFAANPKLGAVVPRGFWHGLEGLPNAHLLQRHTDAMQLRLDVTRQGRIPGGVFWCRRSALRLFLGLNPYPAMPGGASADEAKAIEGMFDALVTLGIEAAGFEVRDNRGFLLHAPDAAALPWLPKFRWAPCEHQWAQETIDSWASDSAPQPTLQFLVLPNGSFDRAATDRSLNEQWLAVPDAIHIPDAAPDRVCELVNETTEACDADWIALLHAGDTLPADATFRLALEIRSHADWEVAYTDSDILTAEYGHINPNFKPDINIDYLRSFAYVDSILLVRAALLRELGGFDPGMGEAFDYGFLLRAWEHFHARGTAKDRIGHIADVLVHRATKTLIPQQTPPAMMQARQRAIEAHFLRLGVGARVENGLVAGTFRIRWPLPEKLPLVSIIIPTRNQLALLKQCVESLLEKTAYSAYEIIIVDNNSDDPATLRYMQSLQSHSANKRIRVLDYPGAFNFSAINNEAARHAAGEYVLLLNNDTVIYHENWLNELVSHGVRPEVGAVGARLLFGNGNLQHAGVVLGLGGVAGHVFVNESTSEVGHYCRAQVTQNYSAVTGACLLIRKSIYEELGGLDEIAFPVPFNDVDICIKIIEAGHLIVWTPFATLWHLESASRGTGKKVEKITEDSRSNREAAGVEAMLLRWLPQLSNDSAFNKNLSLRNTDARASMQLTSSWSRSWHPRPRILAFRADNHAVGNYRIKRPMLNLQQAGRVQGFDTVVWNSLAEIVRINPDTLIFQRPIHHHRHAQIKRFATYSSAFRIFEIDDLLTDLPHHNPARKGMPDDIASRIRDSLALCDRLVASTAPIAETYGDWVDGDVVVLPNYIERGIWEKLTPARAERHKPRVGWSGGLYHMADLELLAPVFRALADDVDFVLLGICPTLLRPYVKEVHVGVPIELYPQFLCDLDLDLALAPLEMHPFNEAKSHLKLLEYGALGYPVVCTDIYPYQGDWPVFRVKNRPTLWLTQIRELLADREALRRAGETLRNHVFDQWSLEDHLDLWERAWTLHRP